MVFARAGKVVRVAACCGAAEDEDCPAGGTGILQATIPVNAAIRDSRRITVLREIIIIYTVFLSAF